MNDQQQFELLILDGEGGYQRHDAGPLEQVRDSADSARLHCRGHAIVTAERAATMKHRRLPGSRPSAPRRPRIGWPKWPKWPMRSRPTWLDGRGTFDGLDLERKLIDRQCEAVAEAAKRTGSVTFWAPGESELADECRRRVLAARVQSTEHRNPTIRTAHTEDWILSDEERDA